jgi:cytochrome c551/c552
MTCRPVRRNTAHVSFIMLAFAPALAAWQQPAAAQRALVNQYCVVCHSDALKTAGVSLENLDVAKAGENSAVWEKVLRKVSSNQMPPAGMPRPDAPVSKAFTNYLMSELDRYSAAHPDPGHPVVHRLNRAEYSNAVRDILALDINPGAQLPADDSGYGFDNIGDVLSLSPILIERYMSVGRMVSRLAVGDPDVKPQVDVFAPVRERAAPRGAFRGPRTVRISDDLPFDSGNGLSFQYTFPLDAEYTFTVAAGGPGQGGPNAAASPLQLRIPVKAGVRHISLTFIRSGAMAETIPGLGRNGNSPAAGPGGAENLDLRLDGVRLKLFEIRAGANGASFGNLTIAGPYNVSGPGDSPSRLKIFVCKPTAAAEETACAHTILSTLVRRAYRRPVTDLDLKPLLALYDAGRHDKEAGSFDNGIEMALRGLLVSPEFLFRIENDPPVTGTVHPVSDFELASRLSFFLWSSVPDDELLKLAEAGTLKDPKVLRQQTARMLDDPKSKAFVNNFAGQYLFVRNLASQKPDPDAFPEYDGELRRAFEQETTLFFNAIVRENRPVTELLDAKFTFLNERLAGFYGVQGVHGPQFRRVAITDPNRGGILGQGSLLTVTSYPNRTSVVQRGKWVLDNLLGAPPPPPPPNVPTLDPHGKDGNLSMRQAMEMHRANPVCATCHSRMDPIGFALENYDGVGAWRDKDNGAPIDTSGKSPDGIAFNGPAGLKQLILTRYRDDFISTFTQKLFTYALGRGVEPSDLPAVRTIMRDAAKQDDSIPALIDAIVRSPQFQMRRSRSL